MRLRQRRKVDLPQPDGPIRAITERSGIVNGESNRACFVPYQNDSFRTSNFVRHPRLRWSGLRPVRLRSEMMAE